MQRQLVITCEHGGNSIPRAYRSLFIGADDVLATHRGYDPGALELAKNLSKSLDAPLFHSTTSRLLVELNRSLRHPSLFSAYTRDLTPSQQAEILKRHWQAYRTEVETEIARLIASGRKVLHVSAHSFTPELDGNIRRADIGLLYDPRRAYESAFCADWRERLRVLEPSLIVRRNYPYLGTADGFTTSLRKQFGDDDYSGIELEVNQKWPLAGRAEWQRLQAILIESLQH